MKSTKKLGEYEYWVACNSTSQIGHIFGPNGVLRDYYQKDSKLTLSWQEEKQAKKDYFEASDSVFQISNVLGTNRVQRKFHRKSWGAPNN